MSSDGLTSHETCPFPLVLCLLRKVPGRPQLCLKSWQMYGSSNTTLNFICKLSSFWKQWEKNDLRCLWQRWYIYLKLKWSKYVWNINILYTRLNSVVSNFDFRDSDVYSKRLLDRLFDLCLFAKIWLSWGWKQMPSLTDEKHTHTHTHTRHWGQSVSTNTISIQGFWTNSCVRKDGNYWKVHPKKKKKKTFQLISSPLSPGSQSEDKSLHSNLTTNTLSQLLVSGAQHGGTSSDGRYFLQFIHMDGDFIESEKWLPESIRVVQAWCLSQGRWINTACIPELHLLILVKFSHPHSSTIISVYYI